MFIRPESPDELDGFKPDFTIINACAETNSKWKEHNLNSEVAIVFNLEERVAVILGTWYGGENKKGIFSLMNYWLPLEGIMAMHCSANVGPSGDSALFFGLSGTGKTTLSADPGRYLIGDDEHGWDDDGIFNFEGGCYAKTINLSETTEPEIYRAITRDALLENVHLDEDGVPDFFNVEKTQNGRVSYPIYHIPNFHEPQIAGHPENIIFLTCDAFGVLPPVSKLSSGQAMYHFLSGYTAKVAGTERGITEPQATFSACLGAAFLTLHPTKYADLLQKKLETHGSNAFLVNTGWSGGAYAVGERMSIQTTRTCINAILEGSINNATFYEDGVFGFLVPNELTGVPSNICNPRNAWKDTAAYDAQATKLATMFNENFVQFTGPGVTDYSAFCPQPKERLRHDSFEGPDVDIRSALYGAKQMMHTQETLPGRVCLYSWRYVEFLSKEYIYTLWYLQLEPRYGMDSNYNGVTCLLTSYQELLVQAPLGLFLFYGYWTGKTWTKPIEIAFNMWSVAGVLYYYGSEVILGFPNVHYPRNFEEAISFEMVLKFWVGFIVFPSLFAVVGIVLTVRAVSYISMRLDERVKRE
eukprot:Stramenopile-MAST_4_protein_495